MTKLLSNKTFKRYLGAAMSVLLVVSLFPFTQNAYGDNENEGADNNGNGGATVMDVSDKGAGSTDGNASGENTGAGGNGTVAQNEGIVSGEEGSGQETSEQNGVPQDQATPQLGMKKTGAMRTGSNTSEDVLVINGGVHELEITGTNTVKEGEETKTDIRHIVIVGKAEVTITGTGTIDAGKTTGTYAGRPVGSVIEVIGKGTSLVFDGPTLTGGTGSTAGPLANNSSELDAGYDQCGGGILVRRADTGESKVDDKKDNKKNNGGTVSATLTFKSGTIEGNEAKAGGGIFVDRGCGFTMDGGTVDNNTATKWEGGGIYIAGHYDAEGKLNAKIKKGKITNNKTLTGFSWGGGGVFVENMSKTEVGSTKITGNTANGLGGGISGCPHAEIGIGTINETVAVFRNVANKVNRPHNSWLHNLGINKVTVGDKTYTVPKQGDLYAFGDAEEPWMTKWDEFAPIPGKNARKTDWRYAASGSDYSKDEFTKDMAMDFYCTKASHILGNQIVGADQNPKNEPAFTGYRANMDGGSSISVADGEMLDVTDASVGLTHYLTTHPEVEVSLSNYDVEISGNTSNTHGGGVGCNGELIFGTFPSEDQVNPFTLNLKKVIYNSAGNPVAWNSKDSFDFTLTQKGTNKSYKAQTGSDGSIAFNIDDPSLKNTEEVTFELSEAAKDDYQTVSPMEIKVKLEWSSSTETIPVSAKTLTKYTPKVTGITYDSKTYTNGGDNPLKVRNILTLEDKIQFGVKKYAPGLPENNRYEFALYRIDSNSVQNVPLKSAKPEGVQDRNLSEITYTGSNLTGADEELVAGSGEAKFEPITFKDAGKYWYLIKELTERHNDIDYDKAAYLVCVDVMVDGGGRSMSHSTTWYKATNESSYFQRLDGNKVPSDNLAEFTNVGIKYDSFSLDFSKALMSSLGDALNTQGRTYDFELLYGEGEGQKAVGSASSQWDAKEQTSKVSIQVNEDSFVKEAYESENGEATYNFVLREKPGDSEGGKVTFAENLNVQVTLGTSSERIERDGIPVLAVKPTVKEVKYLDANGQEVTWNGTVTNQFKVTGAIALEADKTYYGNIADAADKFGFTLQGINAPTGDLSHVKASDLVRRANEPAEGVVSDPAENPVASDAEGENGGATIIVDNGLDPLTLTAKNPGFNADGEATVTFPKITYEKDGEYWYLLSEDKIAGSPVDPTVYVVKVGVDKSADKESLEPVVKEVYYANGMESEGLYQFTGEGDAAGTPEFVNTDYDMAFGAYALNAATNEPVEQKCYVDPKIYKQLEGRSMKSGEFMFQLVETDATYSKVGQVVSSTYNGQFADDGTFKAEKDADGNFVKNDTAGNDRYGMVDFDRANDLTGGSNDPSCLMFTQPGTYYYKVIEDPNAKHDNSVVYNPEDLVITFTVVVEKKDDGTLQATSMYYGHLVDGKNVPYAEQFKGIYELNEGGHPVGATINPNWHPTMVNKAKPVDLKVRKTSASDRNEGLEGATYALFAVNNGDQGDIKMASATSNEDGWITFENVSLAEKQRYYFKEEAAPAGHTVSEFRSRFFYLDNGVVKYADVKTEEGEQASAEDLDKVGLKVEEDEAAPLALAAADGTTDTSSEAPGNGGVSDGDRTVYFYADDGGVYDETTQVEFNKLDARDHEWVEGAKLSIIEKDSGNTVTTWTTEKAPKELDKVLNVDTVYILREEAAPSGYQVAKDVEFKIDAYGSVEILSGSEDGNAELQDQTLTLYDTRIPLERTETQTNDQTPKGDGTLAQTGDLLVLAGLVIAAAGALGLVIYGRRRGRSDR